MVAADSTRPNESQVPEQGRWAPRPGTLVMLTASQGRRWQGRRTRGSGDYVEEEDAASGVPGRRERAERARSGRYPRRRALVAPEGPESANSSSSTTSASVAGPPSPSSSDSGGGPHA